MTANVLCKKMPPWYHFVDRDRFYREASRAIERAVQNKKGRAARQAERQAILMVMEKYGLITITQGGKPISLQKVEGIL